MKPGTSLWRELTFDAYALGNNKWFYHSHRVPLVAIHICNNLLNQGYFLSPLIMNLMPAPVEVCLKVLDFPVTRSFEVGYVQKSGCHL